MSFMQHDHIPRSELAVRMHVIAAGLFFLFVNSIVTLFFRFFVDFSPRIETTILIILWSFFALIWGFWAVIGWRWLLKQQFDLGEDSLIVHKKGVFGKNAKFYRYDTIQSVSLRSGILGAKYNYGTIFIDLSAHQSISLTFVNDPQKYATLLKSAVSRQSSSVQVTMNPRAGV